MSDGTEAQDQQLSEQTRQRFRMMRQRLLDIHSVLLDRQRREYERAHGRIATSGQFLALVLHDEQFDWLHPLSELIVRIDAMLESEEPVTNADADPVWQQAIALVGPSDQPHKFQSRYFDAIQASPDVAAAHARLRQVLTLARDARDRRP